MKVILKFSLRGFKLVELILCLIVMLSACQPSSKTQSTPSSAEIGPSKNDSPDLQIMKTVLWKLANEGVDIQEKKILGKNIVFVGMLFKKFEDSAVNIYRLCIAYNEDNRDKNKALLLKNSFPVIYKPNLYIETILPKDSVEQRKILKFGAFEFDCVLGEGFANSDEDVKLVSKYLLFPDGQWEQNIPPGQPQMSLTEVPQQFLVPLISINEIHIQNEINDANVGQEFTIPNLPALEHLRGW